MRPHLIRPTLSHVTLLVAAATLFIAKPAPAQEVGQKVRVWPEPATGEVVEGQLVELRPDSILVVQSGAFERREFNAQAIHRAELWQSNDLTPSIAMGVAIGGVSMIAAGCFPSQEDIHCITGSPGGDAALGIGGGIFLGTLLHAAFPGEWQDWIGPPE